MSERSLDECAGVARARQHPSDVAAGPTCHHPPLVSISHLHHHFNFNLLLTAIFHLLHRRTDFLSFIRNLAAANTSYRRSESSALTLNPCSTSRRSCSLVEIRADRTPDHSPTSHLPHILRALSSDDTQPYRRHSHTNSLSRDAHAASLCFAQSPTVVQTQPSCTNRLSGALTTRLSRYNTLFDQPPTSQPWRARGDCSACRAPAAVPPRPPPNAVSTMTTTPL